MPLRQLDSLAHVRAYPEMYLPAGIVDPVFLAQRLASDALILGAARTLSIHAGRWWLIAADVDWLNTAGLPVPVLLRSIVPFPQGGINAVRAEAIVTAFADHLITWTDTPAVRDVVVGDDALPVDVSNSALAHGKWARVIAFSLPVSDNHGNRAVSSPAAEAR